MTKCEAERLFKELDRLNEQIEDIREAIQWDGNAPADVSQIVDRLGLASDALGEASWGIHATYQLRDAEQILVA